MVDSGSKQIDPALLLRSAGRPAPLAATRVTGGWDTELWRVTLPDGRDRALRVYRPGTPLQTAERETAALHALAEGAIPVPLVEAIGVYQFRPFLLLSWLRGTTMLDALGSRPWQLWRLGSTLGGLQARIHALPPPALVAEDAGGWVDRVANPALATLVRAAAGPPAFCHGDFHPANVMVAAEGVTGVIDLASVMAADRRADLGITEALLLRAPLPPDPLRPVFQAMRGIFARAWRSGYRAQAGNFPLTPLFRAWGVAYHLRSVEAAVRDGRGWATAEDAALLRRYIDQRMASHARAPVS
jgi:aminoglycoside phosphotransferase (APT) family kinase protein